MAPHSSQLGFKLSEMTVLGYVLINIVRMSLKQRQRTSGYAMFRQ